MLLRLDSLCAASVHAGLLMLGQSAVLVGVLWTADRIAGHHLRAALRHALWMLVVLKLLLPPTLCLPTGAGFWLGRWLANPSAEPVASPSTASTVVADPPTTPTTPTTAAARPPGADGPSPALFLGLVWVVGSLALSAWMLRRHRAVRSLLNAGRPAPTGMEGALHAAAAELGLRHVPRLRLTASPHSPAVFGLFRPVVLLPASMAEALDPASLRDVLLHELAHVQRLDLASNLLQAVVQVLWWWNPLVWFANARIRVLREQAVDERVLLLSPGDAPTYPRTLVRIARLGTGRPSLGLGFVGILERPNALGIRVRRLLEAPLPRDARLGAGGGLWVAVAALVALPMALPMAHARRVGQPSAFPDTLATADVRPKAKPGVFVLDGSQTLTAPRLAEALRGRHEAKQGHFKPILQLDAGVPVERLLETLKVVGEAGIPEVFYAVTWSNSPSRAGGFGATLATRVPEPSTQDRGIVLSIREGPEDYAVDGKPVPSPLAEASWRLEAALRERFGTGAAPTSLTIEVGDGIHPDRLGRALIGAQSLGFRQTRLTRRSQANPRSP